MRCAHGFAAEVSSELGSLLTDMTLASSLQQKLMIRVHVGMPFDEPRLDLLEPRELRKHCERIWTAVLPAEPEKPTTE